MIKPLLRFFNTDGLLKDSSVLFAGMAMAHVINLLFLMFMGRRLQAEEFALLASLMGVLNVLTFPLGVFSTAISRYSSLLIKAGRSGDIPRLVLYWGWRLTVVGVVCSSVCFIFPDVIAGFLHLDRTAPVYIFGIILTGLFLRPVVNGALLGLQRFDGWCWGMVIGALVRLLIGAVLVVGISPFAGWGLLGHGLGFYATILYGAVIVVFCLKGSSPTNIPLPAMKQYLTGSFFIMFGYSIFMTGDVVMVKNLFPESAGDFAYAATLARLVLFVPQSLVGAMFPKVVADGRGSAAQRKLLTRTLLASLASSVATAVAFTLFARILPRFLFSIEDPSDELVRWLRMLSWMMVPVALLSSVMRYVLAQHRFAVASIIPVTALVYIGSAFTVVRSPDVMLIWLGVLSVVSLLVLGISIYARPQGEGAPE